LERALRARLAPERGARARALDACLHETLARTALDLTEARVRVGFARGHLLDTVLELPGARGDEKEAAAAELFVELHLGQALFEDFVGEVHVVPGPRRGPLAVLQASPDAARFLPLGELAPAVHAAVAGLCAGLPDVPLWKVGGEQRWTLLELDAEPADDYPAQTDVLLCSTFLPEALKCSLGGASFASRRFSRCGELFAYLKYPSPKVHLEAALASRRVLEDALDAALVTEQAGRVVGGAMGVRYAYVHFALHALAPAVGVVRTVAARVGLPATSWLLFCDSVLASDWIGVGEAAPPPP
jgi:hypothetical protein